MGSQFGEVDIVMATDGVDNHMLEELRRRWKGVHVIRIEGSSFDKVIHSIRKFADGRMMLTPK
jgi:molecular chaperone GrpE (heat shock protein)